MLSPFIFVARACTDLTTLSGDDTPGNVARLCAKAVHPVRGETLSALGVDPAALALDNGHGHLDSAGDGGGLRCGAVCVYPARVPDAVAALEGTGVPVASVATGFPSGQIRTEDKLREIAHCVADGAREIDIVISRDLLLRGDWRGVYEEVRLFREACDGDAAANAAGEEVHMKTILAVGELPTLRSVHQASLACMMAGADFVKTSTGKERTNATLPVSLTMLRAVREYHEATGYRVGFKPAGGIATAKQALAYLALVKDELGSEWLSPALFRFGASSLLTDICRQLHHSATGEYAAQHYVPLG